MSRDISISLVNEIDIYTLISGSIEFRVVRRCDGQ